MYKRQTYDRDRQGDGEILLAKFKEEDVLAGTNVSGAVTPVSYTHLTLPTSDLV